MPRIALGIRAGLAPLMLVACEQASAPDVTDVGPLSFAIVSGDDQSGPPGEMLPLPLVVKVTGPQGQPRQGVVVTFHPDTSEHPFAGSVFSGTGITNAFGIVQERWILPCGFSEPAAVRLEARTVDNVTGEPIVQAVFHATTSFPPFPPRQLSGALWWIEGNWLAGETYPFSASVEDACRSAVSGVPVTITVSSGTVDPVLATTDEYGAVYGSWTLGPEPGRQSMTFTSGALSWTMSYDVH